MKRRLRLRPTATPRLRAAALVTAVFAVPLLAGCGDSSDGSAPHDAGPYRAPEGTPVVLISIDTLRSDRLPAYGHTAIETPAIEALRKDSVLAERAYSHIPQTLPSHATILTGMLQTQLQLRDNIGYTLDQRFLSLAEILEERGYRTGAFVSSFVLRDGTGIEQGFQLYDDDVPMNSNEQLAGLQRDGFDTLVPTVEWLEQVADDPFFLFFHIYDPHAPYEPPEPWRSRYPDAYDAEVAESDAIVGGLLDALRRLGVYDEALIVLLSDHGEGLMDHGEMDHLVFVYREVLQVPLMVKLPQQRRGGERIASPVKLVDVKPTLLDVLGLPIPDDLDGRSMLDLDLDPEMATRGVFSESNYPRLHLGWSDLASWIEGELHLIDGPDPELYDLIADPAEKNDLADERPEDVRRLRAKLGRIDRSLTGGQEVDAETQARLAALGYVSAGPAVESDGPLPDPKTRLHVLEDLATGNRLQKAGRYAEAVDVYRRVTAEEPNMSLAYQQLGRALSLSRRPDEALDAYLRAFELADHLPAIALSVGEMYLRIGNHEKAREYAELATAEHSRAHHLLARIALREDDLDAAERYLDLAHEAREDLIGPLITRAAVANKRQDYEQAIELTDEALELFGERTDRRALTGLYFQRANAFGHLDRFDDAVAAYRQETELPEGVFAAYSHLAFILALRGDGAGAVDALRRLTEDNPTPSAFLEAARTLAALGDVRSAQGLLGVARQRWPGRSELLDVDLSQATIIDAPRPGAG